MKKIFISFVFSLIVFTVFSQTTTKLSLKQCVETALANSLPVLQAGLQAKQNEITWKQSKLDMLPDLNGNINHGINRGRSIDPFTNAFIDQQISFAGYGLSTGVVLFNGLSMQNIIKQNKLSYDASKMDWQQAKDNLTINIILAYLQVLSSEDVLTQSRNQAELSKQQVKRLELLNKEGAIPPSQLSDLKGQYAGDQLGIIAAQNALETAKLNLAQLMNVLYDKNISLERLDAEAFAVKYDETPDKIYQTAVQQFAQIKAAELRIAGAVKGIKTAKGQLFPTLSFGINANTNYSSAARQDIFTGTNTVTTTDFVTVNGTQYNVMKQASSFSSSKINYGKQLNNNLFSSYGLTLRVPIFNSFQQRNRIKIAELNLKNNQAMTATAKTQLQQAIEQGYINMNTASERYKVLLEQADAFKESFRAAEIRFNNGVGNSIDYLTAKNNLDRTNINLINARYDFVLRTKLLDYYQGKLSF